LVTTLLTLAHPNTKVTITGGNLDEIRQLREREMFDTIIPIIFILIGLSLVFFAHKIGLWWGNIYIEIMRKMGIGKEVPWGERLTWPLSVPVAIWILKVLGAMVTVTSAYILYLLIFA